MLVVAISMLVGCVPATVFFIQSEQQKAQALPATGAATPEALVYWVHDNCPYRGDTGLGYLHYPADTYYHGGDCDDLAFLYLVLLAKEQGIQGSLRTGWEGGAGHAWAGWGYTVADPTWGFYSESQAQYDRYMAIWTLNASFTLNETWVIAGVPGLMRLDGER